MNTSHLIYLFGCGVLAPDQLLPCLKEVTVDPQNSCCYVLLCNVTKSSKEAVADPICVQSIIATRYGMF